MRLNQQRLWLARPEGKIPAYSVDKAAVEALFTAVRADGRT